MLSLNNSKVLSVAFGTCVVFDLQVILKSVFRGTCLQSAVISGGSGVSEIKKLHRIKHSKKLIDYKDNQTRCLGLNE